MRFICLFSSGTGLGKIFANNVKPQTEESAAEAQAQKDRAAIQGWMVDMRKAWAGIPV